MYPHRIRLRGPWTCEPLARTVLRVDGRVEEEPGALPVPVDYRPPGDWGAALGPNFRGRVRFRRHFNRPSGLEPHEQVWLKTNGVDPAGIVSLNGQELGWAGFLPPPAEFHLTPLLADRNELVFVIDLPRVESGAAAPSRHGREQLPGGLIGEVYLEIRTTWQPGEEDRMTNVE